MPPWLIKWLGGKLIEGVVGAVRRRRARRAAEREALGLPSRGERRIVNKILSLFLKLGVVPQGWLTYVAGFAAFALGLACMLGAGNAIAVLHLPCPSDPLAYMIGGAGVIGLRRVVERFLPKPPA